MPSISIIIPVYNVEKYLRRCLDSVLNQTFSDWEAICVNDGSPDNCDKILADYAARDSRFKIVSKKNGGLSDARNVGLSHATGKYIMYLDSDDFIHPQTMEIAHAMAMRDNSDIVSFRYDSGYRARLKIRNALHMNTDNIRPRRIRKKYNISRIHTLVTDDVFQYATERVHNAFNPKRKWLIKHCQVWKNMYRRELIADIPFIKGILFEDFPWWSMVMLKNPRVTIVPLKLYFYIPNINGIVLATKQLRIMQSLCIGVERAYTEYRAHASPYQLKMWADNFMWYFINYAYSKVKYIDTNADREAARMCLRELVMSGALECPTCEWCEMKYKLVRFARGDTNK